MIQRSAPETKMRTDIRGDAIIDRPNPVYLFPKLMQKISYPIAHITDPFKSEYLQSSGWWICRHTFDYFRVALAWIPPQSAACCSTGTLAMMLV